MIFYMFCTSSLGIIAAFPSPSPFFFLNPENISSSAVLFPYFSCELNFFHKANISSTKIGNKNRSTKDKKIDWLTSFSFSFS